MKPLRPYQQEAVQDCWKALKKDAEPVLLMASVGAGKSLMIANILLTLQNAGKRALCLVNNAELVRNNCETLIEEGGQASIYCAALGSKDSTAPIVFGTPQSVLNGITKNEPISKIRFNIIVVDEAHAINYLNDTSCFMRILRHYKQEYPEMRLLGATGTNFRYKGTSIVGKKCLFKSQVGNITTEQLINQGYLINPSFSVDSKLVLDFSNVKIKSNGMFDQKELACVVEESKRKTELICQQVVHIMETQNRFGVFFFATNKSHAEEIHSYLPKEQSAIILGDTPQNERTRILNEARKGHIRYLVNIAIISVGVDIPAYDTLAYLRPTESLVLLVQTMGRVLRLSKPTHKDNALVLDFAGNIERHKDWDNPILLEALKQTIDKDEPKVIECPRCQCMNTEHARRCIGLLSSGRCDYYFEFKECVHCNVKNDIAARNCRSCGAEIIDPNEKLRMLQQSNLIEAKVLSAKYSVSGTERGFVVNCAYLCEANDRRGYVYENYSPISDKAMRVFYGKFVKQHVSDAGRWYVNLHRKNKIEEMLKHAQTPSVIIIEQKTDGFDVKKKLFNV